MRAQIRFNKLITWLLTLTMLLALLPEGALAAESTPTEDGRVEYVEITGDITILRDFRYVINDSICADTLDMSLTRREFISVGFGGFRRTEKRAGFSLHTNIKELTENEEND